MKKWTFMVLMLLGGMAFTACSGDKTNETEQTEATGENEEAVSDDEFEKEMEKLDEDVDNMEHMADSVH